MDYRAIVAATACQAFLDALGDQFEFDHNISPQQVIAAYQDVTSLKITDDTQMTFFGLRAVTQQLLYPEAPFPFLIENAYLAWYKTQAGIVDPTIPTPLYRRRAPGMTCTCSLGDIYYEGVRPENQSRGCGSVMRLLPFLGGLYPDGIALQQIQASIAVTHDHPENWEAAQLLFRYTRIADSYGGNVKVVMARELPWLNAPKIEELGAGFYAMECVKMALWAAYHATSLEELAVLALAHDGDSDSVGAVAGCFWGFMQKRYPFQGIERVDEWPMLHRELQNLFSLHKLREAVKVHRGTV